MLQTDLSLVITCVDSGQLMDFCFDFFFWFPIALRTVTRCVIIGINMMDKLEICRLFIICDFWCGS